MNEALKQWIPLVNSLLSRLSIHPNEQDECRQAALLRLWKSIEEGKVMTRHLRPDPGKRGDA